MARKLMGGVVLGVVALSGFGVAALLALAGPLDPPAGAVSSTYKTLAEVEPRIAINATNTPGDADSLFKITQSGSYYLTGNITGVIGKHGIEIGASGVTLDLNGFELIGVPAMGAFDGVSVATFDGLSITIRNGSIRAWGSDGIEVLYNAGHPATVDVIDIASSDNAERGIALQFSSSATRCRARENGGDGIQAVGSSAVAECSAIFNRGDGISVNAGSAVVDCVSASNSIDGIAAALGSTITGCTAYSNSNGIRVQGGTIVDCTAYTNSAVGIYSSGGSTISRCTAYRNASHGIYAASSGLVSQCTTNENNGHGIWAVSNGQIRDNVCSNNGDATAVANMRISGSDNRVEGNQCTDGLTGLEVVLAGNVIVRNTCAANTTDWVIAANNVMGPILDRRTVVSAAVSGFSAPSSLGSTDANANYSY